ncbi:MAG: hypothetical protein K2M46_00535 [Lachnospiraceae bacterium]|nr:hypothetical protein [Lachnospiraceae bacterium]
MSRFFATFFIIIIFILWYAYERNKATRIARKNSEEFWELEQRANSTRKKSLDGLKKITIPLDKLPFLDTRDEKLNEYQDFVKQLSESDIYNLTGISNTDLKLTYGAPNFSYLSQCDQNFIELARTLNLWAKRLLELSCEKEAQTVLEFAIDCKSDVSSTYEMLSSLYVSQKKPDKIQYLMEVAESLDTLLKPQILSKLQQAYLDSGSGFEDIF